MKFTCALDGNPAHYLAILFFAVCLFAVRPVHAGLSLSLQLSRAGDDSYVCYSSLATNSIPPAAPLGSYVISSPTNAWSETFQLTAAGVSFPTYNRVIDYPDFNSFSQQLTNGLWSILVTNSTSTNLYTFTITATAFNSNSLPQITILFPPYGATDVTNNPVFHWQGPSSWSGYLQVEDYNNDFSFFQSASLPASQTTWNSPAPLPNGDNNFFMYYGADVSSNVVASTPLNSSSQPISGWTSSAFVNSSAYSFFSVTNAPGGSGGSSSSGHTNLAYYSFEDHNLFAHDFSGQGNNLISYGWLGGTTNMPYLTNDSIAGVYAAGFDGFGYLVPPTNLISTMAGSFTVSLWARPVGSHGNDSDPATSVRACSPPITTR